MAASKSSKSSKSSSKPGASPSKAGAGAAEKPKQQAKPGKTASPSKISKTAKPSLPVQAAKASVSPSQVLAELRKAHPDAHCELDHASPFQLLVATVLSAQTTDVAVNKATPALFAAYPDAKSLAAAPLPDVEEKLSTIGMFRQKTRNVTKLAKLLWERHRGEVPRTLPELVELPGVGRKTANVVLGVAFGIPEGVVVDTHVQRLAQRLGFTNETEPEKIETALCEKLPRDVWDITSHTLIFHGRRVCFARKPDCKACTVSALCPSAFMAEEIGRKPKRARPEAPAGAKKTQAKPASGGKKDVSTKPRAPSSSKKPSARKSKPGAG